MVHTEEKSEVDDPKTYCTLFLVSVLFLIYNNIYINMCIIIIVLSVVVLAPVVPHKAVAEVSNIGTL